MSQITMDGKPAEASRRTRWRRFLPTLQAWLYIFPAGILMIVITAFPQLYQAWMAFTDYRITNLRFNMFNQETWENFAPPFVGFENFIKVLTSQLAIENYDFVRLLWFNAAWTISNVLFHVLIGILIALALKNKDLIGRGVYRAVFVLPWAIPGLIIAFTWRNMFDRRFGAINQLIEKVNQWFGLSLNSDIRWLESADPPGNGIPGLILGVLVMAPLVWWGLSSFYQSKWPIGLKLTATAILAFLVNGLIQSILSAPLSYWAVLIANIWLGWPFMTVIATGALQSIPEELYEAARIDGASSWQQVWEITLPLIRPAMIPAVMVGTIWTFNNFNVIFFISQGGPFGRTELLVTQAYKLVFTQRIYGVAAAFSIVVFLVLLIITLFQNRVTRATEAYYE